MKKIIFLYIFSLCQVLALNAQTSNITNTKLRISIVGQIEATPNIITDKFTIDGNKTTFAKTIKVTGTNLLSDSITVNGANLTNYKVSKDSINYNQLNFNLPKEGGKIWIKAITDPIPDSTYSDTLQLVSGNILHSIPIAKQKLLAKPFIKGPTNSSLGSFTTYASIASDAQSFSFYGDDLQGPIKVSVHPPYKLSKIDTNWTDFKDTVLYFNPNSSGSVYDSVVYVRLIVEKAETVAKNEITVSCKYALSSVITIDTSYVLESPPILKVLINDIETDTFETFRDTVSLSVHPQKLQIIGKYLKNSFSLQLPNSYQLCDSLGNLYSDLVITKLSTLTPISDNVNAIRWIRLNDGDEFKKAVDTISLKSGEAGVKIYSNSNDNLKVILTIPESYIHPKPVPSITVSTDTLAPFSTTKGTASDEQSFIITYQYFPQTKTILTVKNPNGYKTKLGKNGTYGTVSNLIDVNNIKKPDTIYVQIPANAVQGKIDSTGLSITYNITKLVTKTVSIPQGMVKALDSTFTFDGTLQLFTTTMGTASATQQFSIKVENINNDITVLRPWGFELSDDGETWSEDSLVFSPINETVDAEIYIRIKEKPDLQDYTISPNNHFISDGNTNYISIKNWNEILLVHYDISPLVNNINKDTIFINKDYITDSLVMKYRNISANSFNSKEIEATSSGIYQIKIDSIVNANSDIGIEYYFITNYTSLGTQYSDTTTTYYNYKSSVNYNTSRQIILPKGSTQAAYKIISFPFDVENKPVSDYLNHLGTYNTKKWRLFKYLFDFKEYNNTGFSNLKNGEAYMLIVRDGDTLPEFKTQKPIEANQSKPFTMQLKAGWNLIGNPYNFDVYWSDVLAKNPSLNNSALRVLNNGNYSDGANLEPFVGGFVNVNNDVTITIPAQNKQSSLRKAQRIVGETCRTKAVSDQDWEINFNVIQDELQNNFVGIGMHPQADTAFDEMDDEAMPHFIEFVDFYTKHNGNRNLHLSKDVTSPQTNKTWNYTFETNNTSEPVTILWQSPVGLSNNIYLVDNSNKKVVSLKENSSYTFTPSSQQQDFKFLYGDENYVNQNIDFATSGILSVAPNPTLATNTIHYFITKADAETEANIAVKDVNGIQKLLFPVLNYEGYNTQKLDLSNLPSGVYFVELRVANEISIQKIIKQ